METIVPVHTDCPPCRKCKLPVAIPVATNRKANVDRMRCPACGHQWSESDITKVVQAWWSAGAWEAERRRQGEPAETFADITKRNL